MKNDFEIEQVFEITTRGAVVVLSGLTNRAIGKAHEVEVIKPNGLVFQTQAFKELLLNRPAAIENEAFLLSGLHKVDIPPGSKLRFSNEKI